MIAVGSALCTENQTRHPLAVAAVASSRKQETDDIRVPGACVMYQMSLGERGDPSETSTST